MANLGTVNNIIESFARVLHFVTCQLNEDKIAADEG